MITTALAAATERFPPIIRKPTDFDISSMCKVLTPILKLFDYNPIDANHNIWVIISPVDKFLACHNKVFAVSTRRLLFGTTIPKDASNYVLHQVEE